ncbi:biotin-dependent carboxyltransferase family protein [Pseudomonas sp. MWU16-30317]|uniref:5-oxoprolinase subunit C family protein n=1 Tax=Pseudomonas sp. MWU16-30317 TaxID=2878095 RepID=UPI001CF9C769|nr:biotin-dependent carboxyltransferase family protein [Pseudomonas sp. MWU16-30317]
MSILVVRAGLCSTVQDVGRLGYQHLGVPVNGPMDALAHGLANVLVGNTLECSSLEVTLQGPTLRFDSACLLAIAGADLGARLDGVPLPPGQAVRIEAGTVLDFGKRVHGARAYLAVQGGYRVPAVLGSRSTFRRGGLGGVQGRELVAGDRLALASSFRNAPRVQIPAALQVDPLSAGERPIRLLPGREWSAFSAEAQRALVDSVYRIGNDSERMGYRLAGAPLTLLAPLELLSEAVPFGTVQVPPSGQPIVLMADRQTTGGYPKIAHVASVDLPLLAQRLPGDSVRFALIDLDQAQALAVRQARLLEAIQG